jgi:hypothetical protein
MNRQQFLSVLVATAFLVGCRQETPLGEARPVPKKTDEHGWPLYEQPADGFALAVPPGWMALQVNPQTLDRMLEQMVRDNPGFKAMEQTIRQQAAAGMKFLGTERADGGPNVNVIKTLLPGEVPLDALAADMMRQYEALPGVGRPITRRRVRLRAGEAERFDLTMSMNLPGGPKRLALTSYALVHGGALYAVTLTAGTEEVANYRATFERIAKSFRFLGK